MKIGPQIYGHSDGRFEARYRKGRKPDGSILYGSVYGRTFNEAEKKRVEYCVLLPRKRKTTLKPRSFKRQQKPADLLSNLCKSEFKGRHFAFVEPNALAFYHAEIQYILTSSSLLLPLRTSSSMRAPSLRVMRL